MDVGIIGCMNMLKYMAENSVKRGIFASSAEVYQIAIRFLPLRMSA